MPVTKAERERKLLASVMENPRTMGERIRYKRLGWGFSQKQLAEAVGVERGAISKYENDLHAMSVEHLHALSEALACSMEWLYVGSVDRVRKPVSR